MGLIVQQGCLTQKIPDGPNWLTEARLPWRVVAHYFAVLARRVVVSGGIRFSDLLHIGVLFARTHKELCSCGMLATRLCIKHWMEI